MKGMRVGKFLTRTREQFALAGPALRAWTRRQWTVAAATAIGFGVLLGIATVLIPNSWFMRDIDTVWWNYPVWILTSVGVGMLSATYVRPSLAKSDVVEKSDDDNATTPAEQRTTRMGFAGGILTWFAVGCPVCNKIALLALGYSGAITWFAPIQPVLAIGALILTGLALLWRLPAQISCPLPSAAPTPREKVETTP